MNNLSRMLISIFLLFIFVSHNMFALINDDLLYAAKNSDINNVSKAIKYGANVNMQDNNGNTALMIATSNEYDEIVKLLLKVGADVNIKDNNGNTALMIATSNENHEIINFLKSLGAK